ncbi:hypothetical protein AALP_AA7G056100 [Arabis alpina]|uniref:Uncharacterized protein n=1 Tax=Arabis alpina TaxID=50452 RepID=A0A087GG44_ARAAL|nr:hypothetical protein AALP_AA7G056100 [Arabis alpina]
MQGTFWNLRLHSGRHRTPSAGSVIFTTPSTDTARKRLSSREQAALKAAAAAKATRSSVPTTTSVRARSSMTSVPKTPTTLTLRPSSRLTPDELAIRHNQSERKALISCGKGECIDRGTPAKRQRVDTYPAAIVEREASASRVATPSVSGLLRDEAYVATKSKASERANAVLQLRLDEFTEQNRVLDTKLVKLKSRCTKGEDEIALMRKQLSSASDLQSTRIGEVVAEA